MPLETLLGLKLAIALMLLPFMLFKRTAGPIGRACQLLCEAFGQFLGMLMYDAWRLFWRSMGWMARRAVLLAFGLFDVDCGSPPSPSNKPRDAKGLRRRRRRRPYRY